MDSPFTGTFFHGDACAAVSAINFCAPAALAFDSSGNLWVADQTNHRLLEFSPPFTSGMAAALVIGQQDFTQGASAGPASNTVGTPDAVSFDTHGDLFVSDGQDNRILIYSPPFTNGMNAIVVLGQPNMTSGGGRTCPPIAKNTLCTPTGALAY
jgi:secreted PhoX family phosphatase